MEEDEDVHIPDDDPEGRQRQEALATAILSDAGAEFVEELTRALDPVEPDDEGDAE